MVGVVIEGERSEVYYIASDHIKVHTPDETSFIAPVAYVSNFDKTNTTVAWTRPTLLSSQIMRVVNSISRPEVRTLIYHFYYSMDILHQQGPDKSLNLDHACRRTW